MAKSVFGSSGINFALNLFQLISLISSNFALFTTCEAVKIWPNEDITIPFASGAVPGRAPNPDYLKPGHVGKTDTTAFSQAVIGFYCLIFKK